MMRPLREEIDPNLVDRGPIGRQTYLGSEMILGRNYQLWHLLPGSAVSSATPAYAF